MNCLEKIDNFNQYHSIEFKEDPMKLWRYFDIGTGVSQLYNGIQLREGMVAKRAFSNTSKVEMKSNPTSKKGQLFSQLFCGEPGCSSIFENSSQLEMHCLSGEHSFVSKVSNMDQVRGMYAHKLKITSQLHIPTTQKETIADITFDKACIDFPLMDFFKTKGWALPKKSNFRYSYEQKKLLYDYFIEGEKSGKKYTPEQVEQLVRSKLGRNQYVQAKQIKSLYSRWTKQLKENKLKEPIKNTDAKKIMKRT